MTKFKFVAAFLFFFLIFSFNAYSSAFQNQQEAMAFLKANMSAKDLRNLSDNFLLENIQLAYQAKEQIVWGDQIPKDIFLNDVLPYANVDETREFWRGDFYKRFIQVAKDSSSISEAVKKLNKIVFEELKVSYNSEKRPKANQSPSESMKVHYASCTGLSILLIDALRSVAIPARLVGIPMWPDGSGNHTWVEIWDGEWKYIGAAEPTELNQTWFTKKASEINPKNDHIFAVSFKKTRQFFPMRWAQRNKNISAIDVTDRYIKPNQS